LVEEFLMRDLPARTPALLTPTTTERVLLPSGREEALPKATPRFRKWTGEFPWSTYGGKPILDLGGEPLYAEFVILRLLEAEGWTGVWVNHVHRGRFPTRWTPSPIRIMPPGELLDLLDRIYARSGKRSGTFDILAWSGENALFAEAKHGGKDALRPSQRAWIEAALDEGVPLESLLVVEWGFGGDTEMPRGSNLDEVIHRYSIPNLGSDLPSPREGMSVTTPVVGAYSVPEPQGASVTIGHGKPITSSRRVELTLRPDDPTLESGVVEMRIKNGGGDPWTDWREYAPIVEWKLSEGEGQKVVYVQFRDHAGNKSEQVKATTTLRPRVGGGSGLGPGASSMPTTRRASESRSGDPSGSPPVTSGNAENRHPEDLEIFFDAYDTEAHEKFLRWRERHRTGYVISRRSATDATLHRAYCGHFEHGDKSASLTRTMKVCSRDKGGLEGWARENLTARLKRCRSCM
jgi:hypothetical protein